MRQVDELKEKWQIYLISERSLRKKDFLIGIQ